MTAYRTILKTLATVAATGLILFAGQTRAADNIGLNNLPADQDFLTGVNLTQNETTPHDPVTASGGDEIKVVVYYHNTGIGGGADTTSDASIARNLTVKVNIPTDAATQHLITGTLSADNATPVTGTIVGGQEVGKPGLTITTDPALTTLEFEKGSVQVQKDAVSGTAFQNLGAAGDVITTTGINIGDIPACFAHAGYITFKVKVLGQHVPLLRVTKEVRKHGTDNPYHRQETFNPGDQLDYRITVENLDDATAVTNLKVKDVLPAGITYLGPATVQYMDNSTEQLDASLVGDGSTLSKPLNGGERLTITFVAATSSSLADKLCIPNTATVTANNAQQTTEDTNVATACFTVVITPSPATPVPTPQPTPGPALPKTGPEVNLFGGFGLSGLFAGITRAYRLKKGVKDAAARIHVL